MNRITAGIVLRILPCFTLLLTGLTVAGCGGDEGMEPPPTMAISTEGYGCSDGASSWYADKTPVWGDLHSHTRFSHDAAVIELCDVDPAGALDAARSAALDFVAITDHAENGAPGEYTKAKWDSLMSQEEAFQAEHDLPIVFPAFEYTKSDGRAGTGHRNILCRDFDTVPFRGFGYDTFGRPTELWAFLNQSPAAGNYLCVPHHPAKGGDYDNPNIPLWTDWEESFVSEPAQRLVEVYSRHGSSEFAGCEEPVNLLSADHTVEWALGLWLTTGNPGYKLGLVGGTDTHYGNPGDVTETAANVDPRLGPYTGGLTAVWVAGKTRSSVWTALQDKACYATSGSRIRLEFTAKLGATLVPMGQTLRHSQELGPEAAAQVHLHIRATGSNRAAITRIQIFRSGQLLADRSDATWGETAHLDFPDRLEQDHAYYRVKIWESSQGVSGERERAWSSPIWVERD